MHESYVYMVIPWTLVRSFGPPPVTPSCISGRDRLGNGHLNKLDSSTELPMLRACFLTFRDDDPWTSTVSYQRIPNLSASMTYSQPHCRLELDTITVNPPSLDSCRYEPLHKAARRILVRPGARCNRIPDCFATNGILLRDTKLRLPL